MYPVTETQVLPFNNFFSFFLVFVACFLGVVNLVGMQAYSSGYITAGQITDREGGVLVLKSSGYDGILSYFFQLVSFVSCKATYVHFFMAGLIRNQKVRLVLCSLHVIIQDWICKMYKIGLRTL